MVSWKVLAQPNLWKKRKPNTVYIDRVTRERGRDNMAPMSTLLSSGHASLIQNSPFLSPFNSRNNIIHFTSFMVRSSFFFQNYIFYSCDICWKFWSVPMEDRSGKDEVLPEKKVSLSHWWHSLCPTRKRTLPMFLYTTIGAFKINYSLD